MITTLTDITFYDGIYKESMGGITIPLQFFNKWCIKASNIIRERTFNNIDESKSISKEVQMCACELAEHMYSCHERDLESDSSIAGEKDGSWSVSYRDKTIVGQENSMKSAAIIIEWLSNTGLLYCGV